MVEPTHLSNEKRAPGCLGYVVDYITQLYYIILYYNKPL